MIFEMSEHVKAYLNEVESRARAQLGDRELLRSSSPLGEDQLRKMDSTLKRTTAFMKKLKNISAAQEAAISSDLEKINLSKFVEEMANSIAEAKIKVSDVQAVVAICVQLSSLYAEFPSLLLAELKKVLPTKRSDKIANPSKLRLDLRLLCELCLHGVFAKDGVQVLGSAISYLTLTDKSEHINVPILLSLCKSLGADVFGLHPYSIKQEADEAGIELKAVDVFLREQKRVFAQLLLDYRKTLIDHVNKELTEMNRLLRSIKRQTRTRGDASAEERARCEETRQRYEKQQQNAIQLSEALGVEMERMVEEQSEDEEEEMSTMEMGRALNEGTLSVWPDEDTRQFYESRMELRHMVPAILFQESEQRTLELVGGTIEDVDVSGLEDIVELNEDEQSQSEGEDEEEESLPEISDAPIVPKVPQVDASKVSGQELKLMMNAFLEQLPWLINRDLIDKAALDFVTNLNTKNNRKKLCQMMLEQYRDRLDLLPFYARLVATLEPVMPDLALELSHALIQQFRLTVQNRSKLRVDWKVRCCRFISELVKFGVIPKAEALSCLRMVLFDFRGHNVDMCCAMVDSMGPFLYRSTDSHGKVKILLEVMLKKRDRINDPRQQMLIDNAYYTCIPPENVQSVAPRRPPLHDFIRHLIVSLTRFRAELTVRCLRKIDWSDPEIAEYALCCLSSPSLPKFGNIPYLASVIAILSSYHDWIGVSVVDNVLEEVRLVLEFNHTSLNQNALLAVVFLGHLYNYSVCDSPIIFRALYQLITYGALDTHLDDWNNLTRVRLVCELLLTCGEYFNGGSARKKLDCFLAYFYRYLWAKKDAYAAREIPFPNEVMFRVEEMNEYVRKGSRIPDSMQAAQHRVDGLEQQYKYAVETTLGGEERADAETEEEEDEEEPRVADSRHQLDPIGEEDVSSSEEAGTLTFFDEAEDVHVHTNHVVLPEDEQFVRQLDLMVQEAMQSRPLTTSAPVAEITVPTSARHKFHRSIAFAEPLSNCAKTAESSGESLDTTRMAILTRAKGNKAVLKAIAMEAPSGLADAWSAERERERREHSEHKHITLTMNERMMADEQNSD
uniref:MIF4G domain-containing protein n=2 Tax=Parascaris univalens TaxID=6257 RepID=A0A914ZPX4_PARUN